jgi:hypothetical protein
MAKKSSTGSVKKAAPSAAPKASAKKAAPKKKAAAQTAAKTATPKKKAAAPKAAAPKAAAAAAPKKKAAPLKLTDKQTEILKRIKDSGDNGYASAAKIEERTLEALKEKKLLKRGAKNKDTGKHHYTLTKTGEKHVATPSTSA